MSEVRLVVREETGDWAGTMHGSDVDRAVAALSADPVTLAELELAAERFAKPRPNRKFFANLFRGLDDEPYDAGLVVVDLIARLIVVDSTYSYPGKEGDVEYDNGHCSKSVRLRYHLVDDWHFTTDGLHWRGLAEQKRQARIAKPQPDPRGIFYGKPLLEFLALEAFASSARQEDVAEAITAIHARWLLTPREDLCGICPRAVAIERRHHVSWDLQDRSDQWSMLGFCPRGLDESSHAFVNSGFGTHELVVYYDLVRELLGGCFMDLKADSRSQEEFFRYEIPSLEQHREQWLDSPNPEFHGRSARSVIHRERARLPEGLSGRQAVIDEDCPCCQMLADMPGMMFWGLDGSNMDDDFGLIRGLRTFASDQSEEHAVS